MPQFPASGTFIQSIRESARLLRKSAQISITPESIKRLLLSPAFTGSFKRVSASHGLALPLNFASPLDELNLLSILALLNFASGYRVQLHTEIGRGAWDSIRAFVFGMYLTSSSDDGDLLSARGMKSISPAKVAEILGVNVHVERAHDTIPGLTIGELGGPMHELVQLITGVLNDTGAVLVNLGYPNLGAFIAETLKEGEKIQAKDGPNAALDAILERIVRAIPAFQDMADINGQTVYCFKKALFLIHAVVVRFGSISPPPFPIPSTAQSPVFADNVLPSMLIHLGLIDLSGSSTLSPLFPGAGSATSLDTLLAASNVPKGGSKIVPKEGPILTSDQAYILRAAAIDACELIIEVAHTLESSVFPDDGSLDWIKKITLPDLDMWIWSVAKDRLDYRMLTRFVLKNTVFF